MQISWTPYCVSVGWAIQIRVTSHMLDACGRLHCAPKKGPSLTARNSILMIQAARIYCCRARTCVCSRCGCHTHMKCYRRYWLGTSGARRMLVATQPRPGGNWDPLVHAEQYPILYTSRCLTSIARPNTLASFNIGPECAFRWPPSLLSQIACELSMGVQTCLYVRVEKRAPNRRIARYICSKV